MPIPKNITKEHLLKAIEKIDKEGYDSYAESSFYDLVYKDKTYPPKLVVSWANIYANGEELNRNEFAGGKDTPAFKLIEKYSEDFAIIDKQRNKMNEPKIWFVTQGSTYTPERGQKFLFAPSTGKDGKSRLYWDNLLKVKKGDIIFNYSEGLRGISIAKSDGYRATNTDPNSIWASEGFRVDLDLIGLQPPISKDQLASNKTQLNKYLASVKNKPFNNVGGVNQGYLYEFTKEAGRFLRELYGKNFGSQIIDNFFDTVILSQPRENIESWMEFSYEDFYRDTTSANFFINKSLTLRFIASLLTKPFVILTGLSGSGKTKLAQAFAGWICRSNDQYTIVPVGADWTNREPLLGFPNALKSGEYVKPDNGVVDLIIRANDNPEEPYFLILDEMNLSHVERYFADFLSVMESKGEFSLHAGPEKWKDVPSSINLPGNLFIIGTVNIDETTYMFSPKVLDRANVIEFRVNVEEMKSYLNQENKLDLDNLMFAGSNMGSAFVQLAKDKSLETNNILELQSALILFFAELKKTGAEFGYRSASEILRFAAVINSIEPNWKTNEIIDAAIMQKLLPKVHGSRRKLEPVLKTLGHLCLVSEEKFEDFISPKSEINFNDSEKFLYPISIEKILRMYRGLLDNGFTSYAEA